MSVASEMEEGGHESRNAGRQHLEAGKDKEMDSPLEPPERSTALPAP